METVYQILDIYAEKLIFKFRFQKKLEIVEGWKEISHDKKTTVEIFM